MKTIQALSFAPLTRSVWVRNEITRLRRDIRAQECEIRMLQRAGASTASAELLLSRMRAKVDDLCRELEALRWELRQPS